MTGREDDPPLRFFSRYGHLHGGGGGQVQVQYFESQPNEGACHQVADHGAADACIAAQYDPQRRVARALLEEGAEGRGVAHGVHRGEALAWLAADGAADAGNGAYQGHWADTFSERVQGRAKLSRGAWAGLG